MEQVEQAPSITRGELGTLLDALEMMERHLDLQSRAGIRPPYWLQAMLLDAITVAKRRMHG